MSPPRALAALVLAASVLLAGCASAGDGAGASASSPGAATSPPSSPPPAVESDEAWVEARLATMTDEQKAATLLVLHAPGTDPAPLRALAAQGIGGLILMGDNVPASPAELATLTSAVQVDPDARTLIAIDEEGGIVQRLPWDDAADAATLRAQPPAAAEAAFAHRGDLLAQTGVDINFGIVADVTDDPDSFIAERILGADPGAAAERVAAAVAGESGRAASTLKHFPGHGAAPGDSHSSVPEAPLSLDEWRAGPAVPFAAGIASGAELVMTGHLVYPQVDAQPASLSTTWHGILRDELGFDGLIVTDDLLMLQHNGLPEYADPNENAIRAVAAGADLLLYVLPADPSEMHLSVPGLVGAIAGAVDTGRVSREQLDDAAERVLLLRHAAAG